ncbi:unnamed protein product [Mytilus edulis]|uniref:Immunoglobulin subtype domain-containing protein n=1 Tax=Mytilus edulis TaxID=6550 RepID=A0A8S3RXS5_MYTED|nr:unnamed protein product [Mytilus edulis]
MYIFFLILVVQVIAPPTQLREQCTQVGESVLSCRYTGVHDYTYKQESRLEITTIIMDRLFKPSTLRVENVNVRIGDGDMEWCCSNIRGAITVYVAGEQCPTSTSMIQPTTTLKSTMAASTTMDAMETKFILAVVMIVVGIIEIIRKFRQRLQNLLDRLGNPPAAQDNQQQAAQNQPIAPLLAQNQQILPQNLPAVNVMPVLRRSQRQIKPVIRLNL